MNNKKLGAIIASAVVIGAGAGIGINEAVESPEIINESIILDLSSEQMEAYEANIAELEAELEVVEPIVEEVIVEVENENMEFVIDEIIDNDGELGYLDVSEIEDADEPVEEAMRQFTFVKEAKDLAVAEVKAELFDELDGEFVNSTELDENDMERLRINDDYDELLVEDIDYKDYDADVTVTGTFEQDDIKYDFEAVVEIKDNEVDEIKSIQVSLN